MTVVVYREGIIASDTWSTGGDMITSQCTKIKKTKTGLWGACGHRAACQQFLAWADTPSKEKWDDFEFSNFVGMHIDNDGDVHYIDEHSRGIFSAEYGRFFAIGGGCEVAMGAMEMGASATEAVAAAAKHITFIGGTCESLQLRGDGTFERFKLEK